MVTQANHVNLKRSKCALQELHTVAKVCSQLSHRYWMEWKISKGKCKEIFVVWVLVILLLWNGFMIVHVCMMWRLSLLLILIWFAWKIIVHLWGERSSASVFYIVANSKWNKTKFNLHSIHNSNVRSVHSGNPITKHHRQKIILNEYSRMENYSDFLARRNHLASA